MLAPYKFYWAATNKTFIYARLYVNKITRAFFFYLASEFPSCLAAVQFSFFSKWGKTSEELPNFSIGIDLLAPDSTSNKNKAEKTRKLHVSQLNLSEDQLQQMRVFDF